MDKTWTVSIVGYKVSQLCKTTEEVLAAVAKILAEEAIADIRVVTHGVKE